MKLSGKLANPTTTPLSEKLFDVCAKLAKKDPTLWGEKATAEARIRLNWIDLPTTSRQLLPELDALSAWARSNSLSEVVLCGMGGSSLAPEVIAATYSKKITILDSTDPKQVLNATPSDLSKSIIVIASKSGTTIETRSQMAYFEDLLSKSNIKASNHFVIITDPTSALDIEARSKGYRVINADPNVGGRFSALTAYGLVPAALIGVDVSELLDDAHSAAIKFIEKNSFPVVIASALFNATEQFITFHESNSPVPGLSDWIEQLIAESTGKELKGRLPVINQDISQANFGLTVGFGPGDFDLIVEAPLGAQFILWEWVTALLCYLLEVDPFNQPNVTEAKEQSNKVLAKGDFTFPQGIKVFENEIYQLYSNRKIASIKEFLQLPVSYFAIMAYLTRGEDNLVIDLKDQISSKFHRATTFGWAPRFLHSTGQFHKGGPANGGFIQITCEPTEELPIAGMSISFKQLIVAQALGDSAALQGRDLPFLQIHLKEKKSGIANLINEIAKA
jgi:glucose-6-phosphate isomerase